jgi:CelD/BcsL family acetyltransferase involved in cellulose biosynthesis
MVGRTGHAIEPQVQSEMKIVRADPIALPPDAAWEDLAKNASEPNPFFEHWFLRPALASLDQGKSVWLAIQSQDDLITGLFPLAIRDHYGRMPAPHMGNWAHYQCFMGTPLIRTGWEQAFWFDLMKALDQSNWAPGFMSVAGLELDGPVYTGLCAAAEQLRRPSPIVHRAQRAILASSLDPEAYIETHVRAKKRKEWRRLHNRLAEMGEVTFASLTSTDQLQNWCEAFLALEAAGWKGERGAALNNDPTTTCFFLDMMEGAWAAGRLDFQRLDLDGRPIAMLINFITPPGSWSFKIAYDEELARFSPGVMIELRNLQSVLNDDRIHWMDSCAVENHPMIDSLWAERRSIVQVSVPLSGARRLATYHLCRAAETSFAVIKSIRKGQRA